MDNIEFDGFVKLWDARYANNGVDTSVPTGVAIILTRTEIELYGQDQMVEEYHSTVWVYSAKSFFKRLNVESLYDCIFHSEESNEGAREVEIHLYAAGQTSPSKISWRKWRGYKVEMQT